MTQRDRSLGIFFGTCFALLVIIGYASAQGGVLFTDGLRFNLETLTIASNGGVGAASGTATVLKSYLEVTCNDTDGCNVTISETGAREGMVLAIVNVSANTVNVSDSSGVSETAGAFAAGQYDAIKLIYIGDRWVELGRSNN